MLLDCWSDVGGCLSVPSFIEDTQEKNCSVNYLKTWKISYGWLLLDDFSLMRAHGINSCSLNVEANKDLFFIVCGWLIVRDDAQTCKRTRWKICLILKTPKKMLPERCCVKYFILLCKLLMEVVLMKTGQAYTRVEGIWLEEKKMGGIFGRLG